MNTTYAMKPPLNEALCEKYGVPDEEHLLAPAILIGSHCLTVDDITLDPAASLIQNPDQAALRPPWAGLAANQPDAAARPVTRFQFVSAAFTLAVFLTYLAFGLGLVEVVQRLKSFTAVRHLVYEATAVLCLVLDGFSFWDYGKIWRGKFTEIAMQLPQSLKQRIHATIRTSSHTAKGYIGVAFLAGVLVSVFELACTGLPEANDSIPKRSHYSNRQPYI